MAEQGRSPSTHSKQLLYVEPDPDAPFLIGGTSEKPPFGPVDKSSALERARAFLPQMHRANQELERIVLEKGSSAVNVEMVDDSAPHIEMNLGWLSESSEDEGDDSNSSEDSQEAVSSSRASGTTLKTTSASRKPKIQIIGSQDL